MRSRWWWWMGLLVCLAYLAGDSEGQSALAPAGLTRLGSTSTLCPDGTACSVAYSPTAGNLVLVAYGHLGTSTEITSVTDNAAGGSSTYASAVTGTAPNGGQRFGLRYAQNVKAGVTSISVT